MNKSRVGGKALAKARRWMTAGLVVSIVGTNLIDGGSSGAVAAGVLPVIWIAALSTVGELISFASPAIAKAVSRFSPARVLVASDSLEALTSALAVVLLFAFPEQNVPVLAGYLLVAVIFPAVTDVVEELYGQQLAQIDVDEAMTFNASIYSVVSFVGLVIAMPLGSVIAGFSISVLVAANMLLSAVGAAFRFVSERTVLTPAVSSQDLEDFGLMGQRIPIRSFARELFTTGAASPLVSLLMQTGATIAGVFVYLWIAENSPFKPAASLGLVIAFFGIGATIGPWIGKALSAKGEMLNLVSLTIAGTVAFLLLTATAFAFLPAELSWPLGLVYAFCLGILSRVRSVLVTTMRQRDFRGARFSRIMSWSLSATALGVIVGSWLAVLLNASQNPSIAVATYAVFLAAALVLVRRTPATVKVFEDERHLAAAHLDEGRGSPGA